MSWFKKTLGNVKTKWKNKFGKKKKKEKEPE